MKSVELLEKLKNKPMFRVQDIERIADCDRGYARLTVNRLKERGLVRQVRRNAYTTKDNIFVIASNITFPSYVSFWSASYFFGYTEQIVNTIQVASTRRIKPIEFENYRIEFIKMKDLFGYRKVDTDEGEVFVAENEKLLIDSLLKPSEMGNFEEIEKIFEKTEISEERVADYLKRINNQTLIKRVGFLLEKHREIDLSKIFRLDRNYVILNPFSSAWKKTNRKWRVRT